MHLDPRGLEPRTLRLLAVRSNQLSYETFWLPWHLETAEVEDAQKPQAQTRMSVTQLLAITVTRLKGVLLPHRRHWTKACRSLPGALLTLRRAAEVARAVVPRGLEPRTLRLLAIRSNQLSYETTWEA